MKHHDSHHRLLRTGTTRGARVDAIVVPAARPSRYLNFAIKLAAASRSTLVVLCSKDARPDEVRRRIDWMPGTRAVVIDVPTDYTIPGFVPLTSIEPEVTKANANRASDLSLKRNLGLLLAKRVGWERIVYLDDDIHAITPTSLGRLGAQLDEFPVAAMASTDFPDNSVVCHANRQAGNPQGVFVSGSVLAVDCRRQTVPFFPDVYNEDWFFFHEFAAQREVGLAGWSQQVEYNPFEDPGRAAREEFGDLLAEGLYDRLEDGLVSAPPQRFWDGFIEVRGAFIDRALDTFHERNTYHHQAIASLEAARAQLGEITSEQCDTFLRKMREDRRTWDDLYRGAGTATSVGDALAALNLVAHEARRDQPRVGC